MHSSSTSNSQSNIPRLVLPGTAPDAWSNPTTPRSVPVGRPRIDGDIVAHSTSGRHPYSGDLAASSQQLSPRRNYVEPDDDDAIGKQGADSERTSFSGGANSPPYTPRGDKGKEPDVRLPVDSLVAKLFAEH